MCTQTELAGSKLLKLLGWTVLISSVQTCHSDTSRSSTPTGIIAGPGSNTSQTLQTCLVDNHTVSVQSGLALQSVWTQHATKMQNDRKNCSILPGNWRCSFVWYLYILGSMYLSDGNGDVDDLQVGYWRNLHFVQHSNAVVGGEVHDLQVVGNYVFGTFGHESRNGRLFIFFICCIWALDEAIIVGSVQLTFWMTNPAWKFFTQSFSNESTTRVATIIISWQSHPLGGFG